MILDCRWYDLGSHPLYLIPFKVVYIVACKISNLLIPFSKNVNKFLSLSFSRQLNGLISCWAIRNGALLPSLRWRQFSYSLSPESPFGSSKIIASVFSGASLQICFHFVRQLALLCSYEFWENYVSPLCFMSSKQLVLELWWSTI